MTRGSLRDLFGRPVGDLLAVIEDDDVVGDAHHHAHVVLDEQNGDVVLLADRIEELVEPLALAGVEPGGGLVEAEQERLRAHGPRDLEPPLVAVGERARHGVRAGGEARPV